MSFHEGGQFEGGRVRRGSAGRTVAVAGGGVGVVLVALVVYFLGGDPSGLLSGTTTTTDPTGESVIGGYIDQCSAEDANTDRQCRLSATVQALDAYWVLTLPKQAAVAYEPPEVVSFDGSTTSACGMAQASTGPFYCPADKTIYIDVAFFDSLSGQLGASGGSLGEMYVVAHEMGHHIQALTGALSEAGNDQGAESDSVRIELQADCLAGMWAGSAATTVDPDTGTTFLNPITNTQLHDAVSAAEAVGDDHIQQQAGYVNPDQFTHGTSEQRVTWFMRGYQSDSIPQCDALHAETLD